MIGSVDIGDHLTDLFLTTTLFASAIIVVVVLLKHTNRLQRKYAKILFLSQFYKPPALTTFAPIKDTFVVTVEPFKFSSRQGGVVYELSSIQIGVKDIIHIDSKYLGHSKG